MDTTTTPNAILLQGDCFQRLQEIPDHSIDMVLTDPPYSSGGLYLSARQANTKTKYTDDDYNGASRFPNFEGDNMDQRSYTYFIRSVLSECRAKTKPQGVCAVFTDWRQLPSITDALQAAGWTWRGIVVWDKGNSRPNPDRFRNDCEYIVWGTNGPKSGKFRKGAWVGAGCYRVSSVSTGKKHHQTEKPVELMEKLLGICPEGGTVLDPFMGSGSTGVACINTGRAFTGIELVSEYFETSCRRIKEAQQA